MERHILQHTSLVDVWASYGMLLTTVHTGDMVLISLWLRWDSMHSHWLCSLLVNGLSLNCRDFGFKAEKRSVRPIAKELEVLEKFMAWLQDVKLIGEMRGEGGRCRSQLWCFNPQHLTVQHVDERFHFFDHLSQLGQCGVVVLLWNPAQPLKVVLIQLQVSIQLRECGLQLKIVEVIGWSVAHFWQRPEPVGLDVWVECMLLLKEKTRHTHIHTHISTILLILRQVTATWGKY